MPRTLSEDDIVGVLEDIIKNSGNAQAKISAIRALREIEHGDVPAGAFAALDAPFKSHIKVKARG